MRVKISWLSKGCWLSKVINVSLKKQECYIISLGGRGIWGILLPGTGCGIAPFIYLSFQKVLLTLFTPVVPGGEGGQTDFQRQGSLVQYVIGYSSISGTETSVFTLELQPHFPHFPDIPQSPSGRFSHITEMRIHCRSQHTYWSEEQTHREILTAGQFCLSESVFPLFISGKQTVWPMYVWALVLLFFFADHWITLIRLHCISL